MKKYELTNEVLTIYGTTLYRIRALRDLPGVAAGSLGGWIESEANLSQDGDCWVFDDAHVYGSARVFDHGRVSGYAHVLDNGRVFDHAHVFGNGHVSGDSHVFGYAHVFGNGHVSGDSHVFGDGRVFGNGRVSGDGRVFGDGDILIISPIGSRGDTLTAHRDSVVGIRITTGCFSGTLAEFAAAVESKHSATKHGTAYKAAINLIDMVLGVAP